MVVREFRPGGVSRRLRRRQETAIIELATVSTSFQRIEPNLYRRNSLIYARISIDGRETWRGTGTDDLVKARKILKKWREERILKLHGIETAHAALDRRRLTVSKVLDAYIEAGFPTPKMKAKSPRTLRREEANIKPIRAYFGKRPAESLTAEIDCDQYRDWRNSGGYTTGRKGKDGKPVLTKGGDRSVDLELIVLSNALRLALRRKLLKANPLADRESYRDTTKIRHCREFAPTPEGLLKIENWFRRRQDHDTADLICFLAYTGLRIGEALPLSWKDADPVTNDVLHVKREKRGYNPFVPMSPDLVELLVEMKHRSRGRLLFPSPMDPEKPREQCAVNRRLTAACESLGLAHVTPHGLRSFYVTQARESGLTDAEIASLIGDKSGPAIIAAVYGDVRPDHLLAQAKRIQLRFRSTPTEPESRQSIRVEDGEPC